MPNWNYKSGDFFFFFFFWGGGGDLIYFEDLLRDKPVEEGREGSRKKW